MSINLAQTTVICLCGMVLAFWHKTAFGQYMNPLGWVARAKHTNRLDQTDRLAKFYMNSLHGRPFAPVPLVADYKQVLNTAMLRNRRPFKCEQCGMKFGRAGGLRRHDMMVHQQRRYACPYEECDHPGYKCTKVGSFVAVRLILISF